MIDLTTVLPRLLRTTGANKELAVNLAWTRAAGSGLRRHTAPLRLNGKTLFVAVGDPIWQKQLQHMSSELVFRINRLLQEDLIDSIEFRVDVPAVSAASNSNEMRGNSKHTNSPAPAEVLFAAGTIADEELRDKFVRAAQNCIARRETRGVK